MLDIRSFSGLLSGRFHKYDNVSTLVVLQAGINPAATQMLAISRSGGVYPCLMRILVYATLIMKSCTENEHDQRSAKDMKNNGLADWQAFRGSKVQGSEVNNDKQIQLSGFEPRLTYETAVRS